MAQDTTDERTPDASGNGATATPGQARASDEGSRLKKHFVGRQIAEVFLLLDNISATKEKKLPDGIDNEVFQKDLGQDGKPKDWLQQIAEIHFPPDGSDKDLALQSAKLYRARDALNAAAAPATSATIAFTLLVANGAQSGPSLLGRLGAWLGLGDRSEAVAEDETEDPDNKQNPRRELALQAFPTFEKPARSLRRFTSLLVFALGFWRLITSAVSWDVATGSALLSQVAALDKRIEEIDQRMVDAWTPSDGQSGNAAAAPGSPAGTAAASGKEGQSDAYVRLAAEQKKLARERVIALENIRPWLKSKESGCKFFTEKIFLLFGSHCQQTDTHNIDRKNADPGAQGSEVNWHWAAVLIAILANNVLPIMYGILGAMASVARNISASTRDYLLSPRHLPLSLIQLALGAVIGAAIGLFLPSQTPTDSTAANWLSNVYLSASALCFLAGFGVEGVFQSLEALVARIFNLAPPNKQQ